MFKRLMLAAFLLATILTAAVLLRAVLAKSRQFPPETRQPMTLNDETAAAHLSEALQCKTVSYMDQTRFSGDEFRKLHACIKKAYPGIHARMQREFVNQYSLMYTWPGNDPTLEPILLLAHLDVVTAEESPLAWTHPPFGGVIAEGCVWGRGALDDKGRLMAILEAAETLVQAGYMPQRTIYLALGHDEELNGEQGAAHMASLLKIRGVQAEFSVDEGLVITDGIVPGVARPLALVALADKGYASFELLVKQEGGHSSQPPPETSIEILAAALTRINRHPMPVRSEGLMGLTLDYATPEMSLPYRVLFSNRWLFGGLITRELEQAPATNAGLRTTITATMFNAGEKDNMLPSTARAVVNCRLLPGDTIERVRNHIREVMGDDRIEMNVLPGAHNASPVSDHAARGYQAIEKSIRHVWPAVAVAPSLDIGDNDSRNYAKVAVNQYRFTPFWFTEQELAMIHGVNERVSIRRYMEAIQYYIQLIRYAAG